MLFNQIKQRLETVYNILNLNEKEKQILSSHHKINHSELIVNDKNYPAWRIIHNNALGPGKGGIRYHPNVSEDEVKSLSFWMSIKNSAANLPYGGAKGGIKVNPQELTQEEIQELSRAYVRAFHNHMGENIDIPAPDVYTNPKIMGYMLDEYENIKQKKEPAFITGKPLELGGIALRKDSTSRGGFIMFQELKLPITSKIAIQGFGNAGYFMARYMHENGYKVVAVSDSSGAIYSENGLDINKVFEVKQQQKHVQAHEGKKISNKELLELDIDVLVLAALENQITEDNVNNIKAKYIIELANGPIKLDVDHVLHDKGILVLPDVLANSGGVVGSYFEWIQNKSGNAFEESYLKQRFDNVMKENFQKIYNEYLKNNTQFDLRTVTYSVAIKRILQAEKARGLF